MKSILFVIDRLGNFSRELLLWTASWPAARSHLIQEPWSMEATLTWHSG